MTIRALTYWLADDVLAAKIIPLVKGWERLLAKAGRLAAKHGASRTVYSTRGVTSFRVSGFAFKDPDKVDKTLFRRLKGTDDGWTPRARTPLAAEMATFTTDFMGDIMQMIKMPIVSPDGTTWTPGVHVIGDRVYLTVPDSLKTVKHATRISDLDYAAAKKRAAGTTKKTLLREPKKRQLSKCATPRTKTRTKAKK